ncbi:hypothetical protein ACJJTC_012364 [Scirpophaga incertulas]
MLLQRRSLRSRLDLLRSVSARELCVSRAQHSQQQHAGGVLRDLAPGEPVWARSFRQPDKWLKGTVANNQGTNRYVVNSGDGRLIPRHIDQIRRRSRMSNVPCPSGTNSDQFEGQVSIGSEDALADSNIPDVGSNDDVAEAISVTKSNSEISVPKPVEDPSEPTCTPGVSIPPVGPRKAAAGSQEYLGLAKPSSTLSNSDICEPVKSGPSPVSGPVDGTKRTEANVGKTSALTTTSEVADASLVSGEPILCRKHLLQAPVIVRRTLCDANEPERLVLAGRI